MGWSATAHVLPDIPAKWLYLVIGNAAGVENRKLLTDTQKDDRRKRVLCVKKTKFLSQT